jgi:cell division protein FtsB
MWTRQYKKRKTGRLIVPVLSILVFSYFSFHAYHGEYGIHSMYQYEARATALEKDLEQVREQRMNLEARVALLQEGSMERDMLDEHARRSLNRAHTDEVVILRPRVD